MEARLALDCAARDGLHADVAEDIVHAPADLHRQMVDMPANRPPQ